MLMPREAGKFIHENSKDVKIDIDGVKKAAETIAKAMKEGQLSLEGFKQNEVLPLDKGLTQEELVNWVFLIDTLNFNFWTPDGEPKYSVTYKGETRTGYMAMVAAVNRAIDEGKKMYDPKYYSQLTVEDIQHIFRSDTDSKMPLFEERVRVLGEVSKVLTEKFEGTFLSVVKQAEGSAVKLVDIVTSEFECYNDKASYEGHEVGIFKRAQILASDVWVLFKGEGLGAFKDMDQLTIFADYRVPQAMAYFGALKYSSELMEKLKNQHLFQSGDREEVEIRGCSIHGVELIVAETKKLLESWGVPSTGVNSIKVDFFLWDFRLNNAKMLEATPYHRVRCIYY